MQSHVRLSFGGSFQMEEDDLTECEKEERSSTMHGKVLEKQKSLVGWKSKISHGSSESL